MTRNLHNQKLIRTKINLYERPYATAQQWKYQISSTKSQTMFNDQNFQVLKLKF